MPLNTKKGCLSCKIIHDENPDYRYSRLYKLIDQYHLKAMTLTAISAEYPNMSYLALRNHAIKHQNPSSKQLVKNKVKALTGEKHAAIVQAERNHTERRTNALQKLEELLEQGELKGATYTALAALLKQETDIEEKQKDRNVDILKIMTSSRSGELQGFMKSKVEQYNPWEPSEIASGE